MSDQSIANIARALAAKLLSVQSSVGRPITEQEREEARISALEEELMAAYRIEIVETLRL